MRRLPTQARSQRPVRRIGVPARVAIVAACGVLAAGCGGAAKVDRKAVEQLGGDVASVAREGALTEALVRDDRTITTNTEMRSAELSTDAGALATQLSQSRTSGGRVTDVRRRALAQAASDVAATLDDLHTHPTDRARARAAVHLLHQLAGRASAIEHGAGPRSVSGAGGGT